MTLTDKIDCIFDEVADQLNDKKLNKEQAKAYIDGANHAFCLCFSDKIKEINGYFDEKIENRST